MIRVLSEVFALAFYLTHCIQAYCCGGGGLLPGGGFCNVPLGNKIAPDQDGIRTQNSSVSYHELEPSASHDASRKRRKKPLAIAVGFNYAEDMHGRPVVITPGTRKIPVDLHKASSRSSRTARKHSPSSVRTSSTGE